MKIKLLPTTFRTALAVIFFLGAFGTSFAQTPGLIYKPATSGGNLILDPDGNGYVSPTTAGWVVNTRDEGPAVPAQRLGSEIPYRPFPALTNEPLGDLTTGSAGGHTDLAPPAYTGSTGSPIAAYYNGKHVMFRVRLGGASTASKGYSVLIDSNGQFASPTAPQPSNITNPGFEFEVVFASNFDVSIYDHRTTTGNKIFSGSVAQFSQRAVAASTGSGNQDYFYDFYVPLTAFGGAITADTPLRFSGITVTSAQSGLTGTVSDMGGVNYASYGFDAWKAWTDVISTFPATSLNQLQAGEFAKIQAVAPVISGPISAGATTVSGTSVEAAGSTINIIRSGIVVGTTTVNADGTWTATLNNGVILAANDVLTATVTPVSKSVSPASAPATVIAGVCVANQPPVITGVSAGTNTRYLVFTPSFSGNQVIRVYNLTAGTSVTTGVLNLTQNVSFTGSATETPNLATTSSNNYVITATPTDAAGNPTGCETLRSNQICRQTGGNFTLNNYTVAISGVTYDNVQQTAATNSTWAEVPTNLSAISGTFTLPVGGTAQPGNIVLYRNGVATGASQTFATAPSGTTNFTISNINSTVTPALVPGDVLSVRYVTTAGCAGPSSPSNLLAVQQTTAAPTITAPGCGLVTMLTGTSTEPAGTVLQFYTGGTAGQRNGTLITQSGTSTAITATVTSQGTWMANFTSASGGGIAAGTPITARAKVIGKVRSVNSNAVSSALPATAGTPLTISPVSAAATGIELVSIRGTGPASVAGGPTYNVTVSIEGTEFAPVPINASGQWEINGISPFEVYAGAVVSARFSSSANPCPSAAVTTTVQCAIPIRVPTVSPDALIVCNGSTATVTVGNSIMGVSYRLVTETGTSPNFTYTNTGSSVLGTGGTIQLTSGAITGTTALAVRAQNVGGGTSDCAVILPGRVNVTVNPLPDNTLATFTINNTTGCAGFSPTFTISTQTGFAYQLINSATNEPVSVISVNGTSVAATTNPVPGTGGTITVRPAPVYATTAYRVRIINSTQATSCSSISTNVATYTLNAAVDPNAPVTLSVPRICSGNSVTISVPTTSGYTYELRRADNTVVGTLTGNGSVMSFTATPTNATTTPQNIIYFVRAIGGGCTVDLLNQVTLQVINASSGFSVSAGANQSLCGVTSATLQGSDPAEGTGVWTTNTNATITNPNSQTTTVTGLAPGSYQFTWTVTLSCATSSATTTVTVNCPAEYLIAPPRFADQYSGGDILARASDPEIIGSASIIVRDPDGTVRVISQNSTDPANTFPYQWAQLQANGNIVVVPGQKPVPGSYTFMVRTIDSFGVPTDQMITITIYGDEPLIAPLPVELMYFTAVVEKANVILKWQTATEENNEKFIVERSTNGTDFEAIGTVMGNGTTSRAIKYSFTDSAPLAGTAYYRLRQVDFDGQEGFSNVIAVKSNGIANNLQLQAYPNPFTSFVTVAVTSPIAEKAQLQLIDMQGRVVLTKAVELNQGLTELNLEVQNIAGGVYTLRVAGNGIEAKARVIKTH